MPGMEALILYLVMTCAVIGGVAAVIDGERGLGREFMQGLYSIGPIFVPVAGIMASVPYLSSVIEQLLGPAFAAIGADPAVAATTLIAVDMGGYKLAEVLAASHETWILAMIVGYMAGATIIFSIPVGLAMLAREDQPYLALGVMAGILSVPVGVAVSGLLLIVQQPSIRTTVSADPQAATAELALDAGTLAANLLPLTLTVIAIAVGLRLFPQFMIRGFILFARLMDALIKLVLVAVIVEYFTGACSQAMAYFGWTWRFDPIIADTADPFRALEIAGYIGIMLAGAFPMVYLIQRYLARPMRRLGGWIGLEPNGAAGLLATTANVLAMYRLVAAMRPEDKVLSIAFAVCGAFLFGDHLAFTTNFQPALTVPILVGKLAGGMAGFALARWLSVPTARRLAQSSESAAAG